MKAKWLVDSMGKMIKNMTACVKKLSPTRMSPIVEIEQRATLLTSVQIFSRRYSKPKAYDVIKKIHEFTATAKHIINIAKCKMAVRSCYDIHKS